MSDTPIVQNSDTPQSGKTNGDLRPGLSSATFRWTARDQYASAAMAALISTMRSDTISNRVDQLAREAYRIADAMIRNA